MIKNPYTLSFSKIPNEYISRSAQMDEVITTFTDSNPVHQVFIITGVRGVGKTVFMTEASKRFMEDKEWIVVELNPERDLLHSLAAKLCSNNTLVNIFKTAHINLSFFGLGVEVKGEPLITDIEDALSKMLISLKKKNKRVLVTIDEVSNSKNIKEFVSSFQVFLRQDLPIFVLMTGLYENIYELQNEKNLTFLYRAQKIELKSLNIGVIADNYKKNFNLNDKEALEMAKVTKGYSFAFQVLGYLTWENNGKLDSKVISMYRQYLDEFVYEKIWSELSHNDRKVCFGIASVDDGQIIKVRKKLDMDTNQFNPYRKRLIKKGIVNGETRGYVKFTLPMFEKYVLENI